VIAGSARRADDVNDSEPHAWLREEKQGDVLRLVAGGEWTIAQAAALAERLRKAELGKAAEVEIDGSALNVLDSVGALLLLRLKRKASAGGHLRGFKIPPAYQTLLETLGRDTEHETQSAKPSKRLGFTEFLERLGRGTNRALGQGYAMLGYLGLVSVETSGTVIHPRRLRLVALLNQIEQTGLRAVPILGLLSFTMGIVLAYQGADQLKRFGAQLFTVNLLGIGSLREVGVLITAIIVAGRSGSAFTAQIGTMKLNQEIDALETFGLDTIQLLVLPRVFGLVIALPLLTLYADAMTLLGGFVMCYFYLNINLSGFLRQFQDAVTLSTLWVGLIKAPVFAFIIAFVGCFEGLRVEGNAESVGRQTTRSVVESLFLVILADGGFSILFSILGI
jgi:phospholipid/cholesterol/gamma-HCH transport system permease protein